MNHFRAAALVLAALLFLAAGSSHGQALYQRDVFTAGEAGYHTFRIPALLVTKSGRLLAFAEGRKHGRGDSGDIDLVLKSSDDGGRTWSPLRVLWDNGANTVGNPALVLDETTGTVWLLLTTNSGDVKEPEIMRGKGARRVWVLGSFDDGETWSKPREITSSVKRTNWTWYATGPGAGIQLRSGRLLIPCDHAVLSPDGRIGPHLYHSHVVFSDDHGKTWHLGGSTDSLTNECTAAELSDGTIYLNMRSYAGLHRRAVAWSRNGGKSWSPVHHDNVLVEPVCQASVCRYRPVTASAGDTLLFSNPASTRRENLTVRLSPDGGHTWPVARTLHAGPAAYSSLAVNASGQIFCLYECGEKHPYERIRIASFDLRWLLGQSGEN
ncbi:MAG: exo-alpha-sialidase [Calditrichaeota bacterium]|nr:exo-alpha-sialidase [Calditrichota bacterium]